MATTSQRGYGTPHQQARKRYAAIVAGGHAACSEAVCLRRSRRISPDEPWDLAHTRDRTRYLGPAHPECNRSEGGKRRWSGSRTASSGTSYSIPRARL